MTFSPGDRVTMQNKERVCGTVVEPLFDVSSCAPSVFVRWDVKRGPFAINRHLICEVRTAREGECPTPEVRPRGERSECDGFR
jgi:hypothetical protein